MFGVTTPCVQQITAALRDDYECLVFHATGIGGQSMEKLVDSRPARAASSTSPPPKSADMLMGGVFPADRGPLRRDHPHAGCPMSARSARSTWSISARPTPCPSATAAASLHAHNPQVTLMRTTRGGERPDGPLDRRAAQPHGRAGALLAARGRRLRARCAGASRSRTRGPTPRCSRALERTVRQTASRQLDPASPHHINDPAFAAASSPRSARCIGAIGRAPARGEVTDAPVRTRTSSCDKFRAMIGARRADRRRRRRHRPLGQMRGGGRHRPHRHLQFRPLPHGRPRLARRPDGLWRRQRDRRRDGARGAAGGQAHAGAGRRQRHRSVPRDGRLPRRDEGASASPACRTSRPSA